VVQETVLDVGHEPVENMTGIQFLAVGPVPIADLESRESQPFGLAFIRKVPSSQPPPYRRFDRVVDRTVSAAFILGHGP
jgi:hypothetical protein